MRRLCLWPLEIYLVFRARDIADHTVRFRYPRNMDPVSSDEVVRDVQGTASELKDTMAKWARGVTKTLKYTEKEGSYKYTPIEPDSQMRILRILPAAKMQADLIGILVPAAMSDTNGRVLSSKPPFPQLPAMKYCALSYWWGDDKPTKCIYIINDNEKDLIEHVLATVKAKDTENSTKLAMIMKTWGANRLVQKKYIRDNLDSALRHMRHVEKIRDVWCDALCMNQDNTVEKAAQIKRMHEVYVNANTVCIWLGPWLGPEEPPENGKLAAKERIAETFDFLEVMLNLDKLDDLVRDKSQLDNWWSFIDLMKKEWFTRRWVIQELALASRPYVRLGERTIEWAKLADSIALFMYKWDEVKSMLEAGSQSNFQTLRRDVKKLEAKALGANVLVATTSDLFRKSEEGRIQQRLLSLEVLVTSMLLPFQASNPRDTIFAVLSLAKDTASSGTELLLRDSWKIEDNADTEQLASHFPYKARLDPRIAPNYTRTFQDLYIGFMEYCVEQSGSLDILCRHWVPEPPPLTEEQIVFNESPNTRMPSWLLSVKGHAFGPVRGSVRVRENADSLVGDYQRHYYTASYGSRAEVKFGKVNKASADLSATTSEAEIDSTTKAPNMIDSKDLTPIYDGTIKIGGFRLARISRITSPMTGGVVPEEAIVMGGWTTGGQVAKQKVLSESLWRTLVADRGDGGISAPKWYRRACERCLIWRDERWRAGTCDGDLDTRELLELTDTPDVVKDFLLRLRRVAWKRTFFLADGPYKNPSDRLFGLAPEKAKVDDIICIILGCSVPVVLRKLENSEEYQFIGECYVHGMMDGEAKGLGVCKRLSDFKLR